MILFSGICMPISYARNRMILIYRLVVDHIIELQTDETGFICLLLRSKSAARSRGAAHWGSMKKLLFAVLLSGVALHAQIDPLEGLWQGYDGEWGHVSRQLVALAEAIPQDKYSWRPGPGVRSTSEVFMHIVIANFGLLSITGQPLPSDLKESMEQTVTDKTQVIGWLKRSLDTVRTAHMKETSTDLQRKVTVAHRSATVDGMYLRIIVHANEHMGQLVAYARVNGIVPPWSEQASK